MNSPRLTFISFALLIGLAGPAVAKEGKLTGFDVLGHQGQKTELKAKLETKGFMGIDPDVKGAPLDFFVVAKDGKELERPNFLGTEKSNDDGVATLVWMPEAVGQYSVIARLRKGAEHSAAPAQIHVAIPAEERQILIVQIDGTVSQATNLKMFRGTENEEIKAEDGAQQVLSVLATTHQLVYMTDLELAFSNKFKDWLVLRGLPAAPILFWELFERSLSHETYMTQMVERLQKSFNLTIGIGATTGDMKAFRANALVPIRLADEPDSELGDEVVHATDWGQALAHVVRTKGAELLIREYAAGKDAGEALRKLSLFGAPGVAYLSALRRESDLNLAAGATLVVGKLRGIEAFVSSLDRSSADRTLNSLIASWRYGQPAVVKRLFADGVEPGPMPVFSAAELVSRNEPAPGKVAFKLRLKAPEGKEPSEASVRELIFVEQDDSTWLVGK